MSEIIIFCSETKQLFSNWAITPRYKSVDPKIRKKLNEKKSKIRKIINFEIRSKIKYIYMYIFSFNFVGTF